MRKRRLGPRRSIQFDIPISAYARSRWTSRLAFGALFVGCTIVVQGVVLNVECRWAIAHEERPILGFDATDRTVLIQTPERFRVLRTRDRLLVIREGDKVCVAKRTLLSRRWQRYGFVLPGYCRRKPMLMTAPDASVLVVD